MRVCVCVCVKETNKQDDKVMIKYIGMEVSGRKARYMYVCLYEYSVCKWFMITRGVKASACVCVCGL